MIIQLLPWFVIVALIGLLAGIWIGTLIVRGHYTHIEMQKEMQKVHLAMRRPVVKRAALYDDDDYPY